MFKLIINNPDGYQEIIKVHQSGSYHDKAAIVWDERVHGPLPALASTLGGLERFLNNGVPDLRVDAPSKAAHDIAIGARNSTRQAAETKKANALADIKLGARGATTVAALRAKVQSLIEYLGIE